MSKTNKPKKVATQKPVKTKKAPQEPFMLRAARQYGKSLQAQMAANNPAYAALLVKRAKEAQRG